LWVFYRETSSYNNYDKIYATSSSDGITWDAPVLVLQTAYTAAESPAICKKGSTYYLFVSSGVNIFVRVATTITGMYSAPTPINLAIGGHLDVICPNGVFYGLFIGGTKFATSDDGIFWAQGNTVLAVNPSGWDSAQIYRSSIVKGASSFAVWYAARKSDNTQDIGYTTLPIT
jgi:hypothetical protein